MNNEMKRAYGKRTEEIVAQMTLEEKCSQLRYDSPAIERLNIPAYNWWNEGLHGVARAGTATVFPQAIGLAAMFDDEVMHKVGEVIGLEARAKYNEAVKHDDRDIYKGLTLWAPNVNIFRDPRWGRGHETYGEDTFLTAALGKAFVEGIQGNGEHLTAAACAKHFAVHSGPEAVRHEFNAVVSEKDLAEYYLPAFKTLVEADVAGVMGAYNRVNGEASCASDMLTAKLSEWGFDGYFVSDCWAVQDFHLHHHITDTALQSAALAIKHGCHVNCGCTYLHIMEAYEDGLVSEEDITKAAERLMKIRLMLGMHDKTELDDIPYEIVDCAEHRELAYECAAKSVVLLKNDGLLPLDKSKLKTVGVIGSNANSRAALIGNYHGTASEYVTFLDGIRRECGDEIRVMYAEGCNISQCKTEGLALPDDRISEAVTVAEHSDVAILCLGLDETLEGEEGDTGNAYFSGDKTDLRLPASQQRLLSAVVAVGKPVVVVLAAGSSINIETDKENALLLAWYAGEQGGRALADILFGKRSPSGKLPVTFYENTELLPEFTDYSMSERTYRNCDGNVLFPFGFGLTYSDVQCIDLAVKSVDGGYEATAIVCNTGDYDTDEVIQLYLETTAPLSPKNFSLCGFKRVRLEAGEERGVTVFVPETALMFADENGKFVLDKSARYILHAGTSQPDKLSAELATGGCTSVEIVLE